MTVRRTALRLTALVFLAAATTGAGFFHNHLTKSNPAAKAALTAAPTQIRLWFAEKPELALTRITLRMGPVLALEALWDRLGIGPALKKVIQQHGYTVDYERALFAMTANRVCEPESKRVWDRWLSKVYLPSCWHLKLDQMYEAKDMLQAHSEAVEEAVFYRTSHLFNLEVDLIFYDTTTAAFAIDEEDEEGLRQLGRP